MQLSSSITALSLLPFFALARPQEAPPHDLDAGEHDYGITSGGVPCNTMDYGHNCYDNVDDYNPLDYSKCAPTIQKIRDDPQWDRPIWYARFPGTVIKWKGPGTDCAAEIKIKGDVDSGRFYLNRVIDFIGISTCGCPVKGGEWKLRTAGPWWMSVYNDTNKVGAEVNPFTDEDRAKNLAPEGEVIPVGTGTLAGGAA